MTKVTEMTKVKEMNEVTELTEVTFSLNSQRQTSTSHDILRWSISAGHDPSCWHSNCVFFICGMSVPNNQFSVLKSQKYC